MSKLLSDEELKEKVYFYGDLCAQLQSFTTIKTVEERNRKIREEGDKLINLIHSQKLAHGDMVIGENDDRLPKFMKHHPKFDDVAYDEQMAHRNSLREEQRERNK